jgi:translation initiation factor IF-3
MTKPQDKRMNEAIRASQVRVITEEGDNLWLMSLSNALEEAYSQEKDLVEVGLVEWVPLCKIMDYGKFLFKQQKQQSKNRSQAKKTEQKTLKITYKIEDHDLEVRRNQAEKFAQDGHPLKVELRLRWRENHFSEIAFNKVKEFVASLSQFYKLDRDIVKNWNTFVVTLTPLKK